MVSDDSPAIARRRVRLALREMRESRHLTQSDVAEAMEWSLSKVIRIESGEVSISPNDLRPLLTHYGIDDSELVNSLITSARTSRSRARRWWQEPPFKEHLTPALSHLIEYELDARGIRYFSLYMIPGTLQTEAYARAVLNKWHEDLPPDALAVRLDARMRRRENVLRRSRHSPIALLLDEAILHRPMGGVDIFRGQLTDLLRLAQDGQILLRIVPFGFDAPPPTYGPYELLYLTQDGDDDNAVIYRENHLIDEIIEDRTQAAIHRARFDTLWNAAKDQASTRDLIQKRLAELGGTDLPDDIH